MRRRCCGDALAGSALFSSSIEVTTLPSQRRKNLPAENSTQTVLPISGLIRNAQLSVTIKTDAG
jgi:hypothetical protein